MARTSLPDTIEPTRPPAAGEAARPTPLLVGLVTSLRPSQWTKNLFVFAGLIFAQQLFTPKTWTALVAFGLFCALSSAIYLINDVMDYANDRLHPTKRRRPIAAGVLPRPMAVGVAVVLLVGAVLYAFSMSLPFGLVALGYGVLLTVYSLWLKKMVILDVLTISVGFVLRAIGGAVAIAVEISGWLLICTILMALFLALGKRRHELLTLPEDRLAHRPILAEYNAPLLDQLIAVVTASSLTSYALYTMAPETVVKFHTRLLPATIPFVVYGIFRYLYLLYRKELGGSPAELLLSDRPLLVNAVLWAATVVLIVYGGRLF